jgi:DNA-binding transcriptional ArsR family regulator
MDDDGVFRALADPGRRALLDALFVRDGQTLTELCEVLPDLTRFGVMKHLRVLADAGLVVPHKVGRHTHHHLNPIPIQLIGERWIAKYAAGAAAELTDLARRLESQTQSGGPA